MDEKEWERRIAPMNLRPGLEALDPKAFTDSIKSSMVRDIYEMSDEELKATQVAVQGILDPTLEQDARGTYARLKPASSSSAGAEIKIYPMTSKGTDLLEFYVGRSVRVEGWLKAMPTIGKEGMAEASLTMAFLVESHPNELLKEKERNPKGKLDGIAQFDALVRKIEAEGTMKIGLIGPERNGIDLFRREFQKLAQENPFLKECVVWEHIDMPIMPRGYSPAVVDKFYAQLGEKIQAISEGPKVYDLLCLLRGDGQIKDLARLNNAAFCFAVIRNPIPIWTALGNYNRYLWLTLANDGWARSPEHLAKALDMIARQARSQMQLQPVNLAALKSRGAQANKTSSSSSSVSRKTRKLVSKGIPAKAASSAANHTATKPAVNANPKANTPAKPTKTSSAKTATMASTSTRKTPKAAKTGAQKTTRKTAAKVSKAKPTATPTTSNPEERPKKGRRLGCSLLLALLFLIFLIAVIVYTQQS